MPIDALLSYARPGWSTYPLVIPILGFLGVLVWHFRLLGSTRGMIVMVVGCAGLFLVARELWDRRPANEPERAIRLARSSDPDERGQGTVGLRSLVVRGRLRPEHIDPAISSLRIALRDGDPDVKEAAARSLHWMVSGFTRPSLSGSQTKAIAATALEGVQDPTPVVRHLTMGILANLYLGPPSPGSAGPPLPDDTTRFVAVLGEASEDPDTFVQMMASGILQTTASRLKLPSPGATLGGDR